MKHHCHDVIGTTLVERAKVTRLINVDFYGIHENKNGGDIPAFGWTYNASPRGGSLSGTSLLYQNLPRLCGAIFKLRFENVNLVFG